jgi:hypothetical protein
MHRKKGSTGTAKMNLSQIREAGADSEGEDETQQVL